MPTRTLHDLLHHELRELYDAEHELVKILQALGHEVRDERTAQLLNTLRCETRNHVFGLEQVLSTLGEVPRRVKCRGLHGLVEGYNAFLRTRPSQTVLDTFDVTLVLKALRLIGSAYRTLITLALRLDHPEIVDQLRQQLWDAEAAAERLQQQVGRIEPQASADGVSARLALGGLRPDEAHALPAPPAAAPSVPPDSPEDRENVLAGGQDSV